MAFDGLTLKAISCELKSIISYKIDKVFEPTKDNIVLGLYGEGVKVALNICIDSKFYRINLTTHPKPNPLSSPNFCMLLRKHLIGYKIKNILTNGLERVITFELEPFDPYDSEVKYLIIELMGKHSNIILTDRNNIIIDSIRHTNISNNSYRNIFPKQKYVFPNSDKLDIESIDSFDEFYKILEPNLTNSSLAEAISNRFTGISLSSAKSFIEELHIEDVSKDNIEKFFILLKDIIKKAYEHELSFKMVEDNNDYRLKNAETKTDPFCLNLFIDDFYYKKEASSDFSSYRNSILKLILDMLKKYTKRLANIDNKLDECSNMDMYKLYGELLTANLYKLGNEHLSVATINNYYTGKDITIPLNKKYTVSENSKIYFKKYNKLKNAISIVQKQKEETILEINYIESVVYELENTANTEEVKVIFEEISENIVFKDKLTSSSKKHTKSKKKSKVKNSPYTPLSFDINGYTVLVGRNNRENDWLTTKQASPSDLWFHAKDIHGSHVILKCNNPDTIENEVLIECAKLAAKHSKAKNSSNVAVDYCPVKNVKKPNSAKPGMVIYTHNKTLYVNP